MPKKLIAFFDQNMLQLFELSESLSKSPFDRNTLRYPQSCGAAAAGDQTYRRRFGPIRAKNLTTPNTLSPSSIRKIVSSPGAIRAGAAVPFQLAQVVRAGDSNPHRHRCPTDFLTSYGFRRLARGGASLWSGLSLHHAPTEPKAPPEVRCCPSSLYTFPSAGPGDRSWRAWLGIAMEQGFPEFGQFCIQGFPRSTQVVSQVRCVYRFRHARITMFL